MKKHGMLVLLCLLLVLTGCSGQTEAEPFQYEEIADIFDLTETDVQQMYGKPDEVMEDVLYGVDYRQYIFGENRFAFYNYENSAMQLCEAAVADARISCARDIQLGDSLKDIRQKYPDAGSKAFLPLEGNQNGTVKAEYRLLYGEYAYMSDYGIEVEAEDGTEWLVYSNEGVTLRYYFKDASLARVEYILQVF